MATLEEKITEAFTKQMRVYLEQMQHMVRVTLLEPYEDWRTGSTIVTMRHGATEARVVGQPRDGEDDEVIDLTQGPRKIIPGKPIHYHLSYDPVKDMRCMGPHGCSDEPFDIDNTIIMPLPAAEIYFGHWLKFGKISGPGDHIDTYDTVDHQKKLVAECWGGYRIRPFDPRYDAPKSWRKLEKVCMPAIPNVEIVRLDTQLRAIPHSTFRPLETYNFGKEVVPDRWTENPADRIISVTESQFDKMVSEAVAKHLERGNNLPQKARTA